jgi:hypothetical protein
MEKPEFSGLGFAMRGDLSYADAFSKSNKLILYSEYITLMTICEAGQA